MLLMVVNIVRIMQIVLKYCDSDFQTNGVLAVFTLQSRTAFAVLLPGRSNKNEVFETS
jgi:hypothetical protein